jgi:hypothetical protein
MKAMSGFAQKKKGDSLLGHLSQHRFARLSETTQPKHNPKPVV